MWVNTEKYIFSEHILENGKKLFGQFEKVKQLIFDVYKDCQETYDFSTIERLNEEMPQRLSRLQDELISFDKMWATYEKEYIGELMVIEADARRYVIDVINSELSLSQSENQGRPEQVKGAKEQLIKAICSINAVANVEGKGRDDFTSLTLQSAESVLK